MYDEEKSCGCVCHRPTGYMEVCRQCCVQSAKDRSFALLMLQNERILKLIELLAVGQMYYCGECCSKNEHDETCQEMDSFTERNSTEKKKT